MNLFLIKTNLNLHAGYVQGDSLDKNVVMVGIKYTRRLKGDRPCRHKRSKITRLEESE
jgi:hypothetical protein